MKENLNGKSGWVMMPRPETEFNRSSMAEPVNFCLYATWGGITLALQEYTTSIPDLVPTRQNSEFPPSKRRHQLLFTRILLFTVFQSGLKCDKNNQKGQNSRQHCDHVCQTINKLIQLYYLPGLDTASKLSYDF